MNAKDLLRGDDRRGFLRRATQMLVGGSFAAGAGSSAAASLSARQPTLQPDPSDDKLWRPRAADPLIGEIMMVGFNFAPRGWALCDGQLLPIAQNSALFSLLGTIYGGDGRTTFALPDLRGRFPTHMGTGAGLSQRQIGSRGGTETTTLNATEMPAHAHGLSSLPDVQVRGIGDQIRGVPEGSDQGAATLAVATESTGGSQAHNNMPPFLCINFVIALTGVFPSRN
jgi:microcystin-dependent protein